MYSITKNYKYEVLLYEKLKIVHVCTTVVALECPPQQATTSITLLGSLPTKGQAMLDRLAY